MKYHLLEHVSLTEVDDEAVLLNLDSGSYYGLNHIGTHLVRSIRDQQPIEQAIEEISTQYQTERTMVESDVDELLAQLLDAQLIGFNDHTR